jgi:hypothetical protein
MTSIDIPLLLTCPPASRCKGLNAADVSQCIDTFSGMRSPTALDMSRGRTEDKLVRRSSVWNLSRPTTAVFAVSSVFAMRRWSYRCRSMLYAIFLIKWSGVRNHDGIRTLHASHPFPPWSSIQSKTPSSVSFIVFNTLVNSSRKKL